MSSKTDQEQALVRLLERADELRSQTDRIEDALVYGGPLPADFGAADIKAAHDRLQAELASYSARWPGRR